MLNMMELLKRSPLATINWSGLPCQLTMDEIGRKNAATALIQMLLERWSPLIEYVCRHGASTTLTLLSAR
jgi:hypothetical protein